MTVADIEAAPETTGTTVWHPNVASGNGWAPTVTAVVTADPSAKTGTGATDGLGEAYH